MPPSITKNTSKLYVGRIFQIKKMRGIYCERDLPSGVYTGRYFRTSFEKLGLVVTILDEAPKYVKCLTGEGIVWFKKSCLLKEITPNVDSPGLSNSDIIDEAIKTITNTVALIRTGNDIVLHGESKKLESLLPILRKVK